MANWAYIEDNEEDPAAWRIESIEYHPGEPAVTHCFTDARARRQGHHLNFRTASVHAFGGVAAAALPARSDGRITVTSKTQAPALDGVNWRKRASELPGRYKYNVGMLKPEETTSGLGYMVDCNQSETKWAAYRYTADNSQWWAAHGDGNPRDLVARLEVADGKDYAAVQQIDDRTAAFAQLAGIDWNNVPVAAGDHMASRLLAGKIRDFKDYYQPEHTRLRSTVEGWLTRYSAAHAYRPEN